VNGQARAEPSPPPPGGEERWPYINLRMALGSTPSDARYAARPV